MAVERCLSPTFLDRRAMPNPRQMLFINAYLVGWPRGPHAVLVADGKVGQIAAGEGRVIDTSEGAEVVDCRVGDGALWISPGMVDWHTHQMLNAVASHRLHLSSATSAQQALDAVARALADPKYSAEPELSFVAVNMRNAAWTDAGKMSRASLDRIAPARPVYLVYNGYHSICCNTAGLERAGLRVEDHPDGVLLEQLAFKVGGELSNVSEDVLDQWIFDEARYAASLGVVEVVDLEMSHNLRHWQRRCAKGFDTLRVHIGFYDEHLDDALSLGLRSGDAIPGCSGRVLAGPYKIVTDGSLGSQTAYCHDVYPGTATHGIFNYRPRTLAEMVARGARHGFRLAVHAIGDHANRLALRALADCPHALRAGSTIEHAQLLNLDDLPLFADLGLVASIQPCHLVDDRELCHAFWPGREGRAYPFKALVDAGIPIRLGSDAPVAPLHPWEAIAVAISRAGQHDASAFCPEQIIDVHTAFAASTCNGKAHIDPGENADICLLSANPLECDATAIRAIKCSGTLLQGAWTYRDWPSRPH